MVYKNLYIALEQIYKLNLPESIMPKRNITIVNKYKYKTAGGGAYFLGFIGALVYYLQTASGFWNVVLAILKSIVWPAFAVYHLLGL